MQLHVSSLPSSPTISLKTRRKRDKTKIKRIPTPKHQLLSNSYPKPSPTPLLITPLPSSLPKDQAFTRILKEIQSSIERGVRVDTSIFSSLLETCFQLKSPLHHVTLLRSLIPPSLLRSNAGLSSKLLRIYAVLGRVEQAHQLFDLMPERNKMNAFAWNSLISGYVERGLFEDAMAIYYQMEEDGVEPDQFTFPRVLKACAGIGSVQHGEAVHRHIVRSGFGNDIFVLNALIDMYAKCGDILKARHIFDLIVDRDSVTWNSMLVGYIRHGLVLEAMDTCRGMISARLEPDSITLSAMLAKFSSVEKLGLEIHCWVLRRGLEQNLSVANSLIGLYSECNQLSRAVMIFQSIQEKDLVSWNAIISAHRRDPRVLCLFQEMEECGQLPDKVTFVSLLSACANLGMVEDGQKLFSKMVEKYKIRPEMVHYGCIVNMLGRAGLVEEAYDIVSNVMPFDAGQTVWGALLFACSVHGNVDIGEIAAERLFELEPDNEHNFELMMKIYRNAGLLEGIERIRRLMRERGLESESCV
nr:pentatricopeptide repeat protein AaPPR52 [Agave angustifolia]UPT48435.1 pentatricopeptide repeat protein AaPPR74 [Agave angustifolia]